MERRAPSCPEPDEAVFTAGGLPWPVGVGLLTGLVVLFLCMLGGPAAGLPVAAAAAYLALYTLGYLILRPSRARATAFARHRAAQVAAYGRHRAIQSRVLAGDAAANAGQAAAAAWRSAREESRRKRADVRWADSAHRSVGDCS